jgi:general secretion pathway protein G
VRGGRGTRKQLAWVAGVLVATAFVAYAAVRTRPFAPAWELRTNRAHADVDRIATVIETFRKQRGRYPTNEEGLQYLIAEGLWRPNAPDGTYRDPWGRLFEYERPGRLHPDRFDVRSYGADGEPGGDGEDADICNE